MDEVKEMEERRTLLIMAHCLGFCPKCAAKNIKSKLVDFYPFGAASAIKDFCQQCKEAWPKERVMKCLHVNLKKFTDREIIRYLIYGGKIPEDILEEITAIRHL